MLYGVFSERGVHTVHTVHSGHTVHGGALVSLTAGASSPCTRCSHRSQFTERDRHVGALGLPTWEGVFTLAGGVHCTGA